ncbi:MAG: hypothetical protein GKR87_02480 [Kiritimatiellae bacterium]|nr:hypothetical protein [Kiritimatiellia bacterium]NKB23257.1 hypothetical protein [Kiritimatiellia bacterium]
MDFFDEKKSIDIIDPDDEQLRYSLCKNPTTQKQEGATRNRLPEKTREGLKEIADYKRAMTVEKLGARVGKILAKYKMGKFIKWSIQADEKILSSRWHKLIWQVDQDKVVQEERLDGCYIIRSDVQGDTVDGLSRVEAYKSLGTVERAFRNLKTVQLETRPVYHKIDRRIQGHVFLCMLAYYVQWHMQKRLAPLFASDGKGENRRWSFSGVIECLKNQGRHEVEIENATYQQDGKCDAQQQKIMDLLSADI